jgi:hypothetical protein
MTIEEVSVLFDTGRKGDASAAARKLGQGEGEKELELVHEIDDAEKGPETNTVSRST